MYITNEYSSIATLLIICHGNAPLPPLNNVSQFFGCSNLVIMKKNNYVSQVGLEGQLCEEVYPRSVYFLNIFILYHSFKVDHDHFPNTLLANILTHDS